MEWQRVAARSVVSCLGAVAVAWASVAIPIFRRDAPLEQIAHRIIDGESYGREALKGVSTRLSELSTDQSCHAIALWSAAVIRLRLYEQSLATKEWLESPGQDRQELKRSITRSLSCSPAEPLLWLVMYRLARGTGAEINNQALVDLRLSYSFGPNEGWVALKRSPIVFSDYVHLPLDIRRLAIAEFVGLIESRFYSSAADIFAGPAWPARDAILNDLSHAPRRDLEIFARLIYDRGLQVTFPGIPVPRRGPRL